MTFLPHPRTCSRNTRSVSVKGRSAEVTNSTRSERGTNSDVIASCSRMIALVPGVSTMWISRRISAGAVMTCRRRLADLPLERLAVLQHVDLRRRRRHAFLGDLAADQRVDEGALAGVELADDHQEEQLVELGDGRLERLLMLAGGVEPGERDAQAAEHRPLLAKQLILWRRQNLRQHARGVILQDLGQLCSGFFPPVRSAGLQSLSAGARTRLRPKGLRYGWPAGRARPARRRLQSVCGAWFSTIHPYTSRP